MNITFATRKLDQYGNDFTLAKRKLGPDRATKFQQRLGDMRDIDSFAELKTLPGHFHPLSAERNGQWACDLDQPFRLIFEPAPKPVPCNEHGTSILSEIRVVKIIEIVDYH